MAEFKRGVAAGARAGIPWAIITAIIERVAGTHGSIGFSIFGAIYAAAYGHLPGAKSTSKGGYPSG